ncbi:MAG TPA: FAD-linked oxidase C-terminal domain-containing protein [Burkholderiaceae bacterium]|nr:FAD-linked oxidase C-terminal domain-containing protein [Burkholderiaceae bacterium]
MTVDTASVERRVFVQPSLYRNDLSIRLRRAVKGEVLFDAASRGRYSTDASIYQVEPIGVLVPRDEGDVRIALEICNELKVPVLARGAGSSQCGQTVGRALVIDYSKHLNRVIAFDKAKKTVEVQPGLVLDALNAALKPHGLWFPVDVSTSAQATLGGMAGNNSCGSRSIAYGNMVHNVAAIDALLADGTEEFFGPFGSDATRPLASRRTSQLVSRLFEIGGRERSEIERLWPTLLRRVGGYNLDVFHPRSERPYTRDGSVNLAHLLVGSEGTLALTRRLHLNLAPLPAAKVLGVINFPTFRAAMEAPQHLVKLGPTAVELVDRTMIDLARANPAFRKIIEAALIDRAAATPAAILLVEFAGDDKSALMAQLKRLVALMGDLGLPGSVVEITADGAQKELWEVRKAGLNIMMSLRGDGKPVSFIEDCAVPLESLADYTAQLTEVFERHGTRGTWYAHASVGTLHVRPILDMRRDGARKMRAIAEDAAVLVRKFKGAYSGEHGDGLVRSEWVAWQFGPRLTRAFEEIKDLFDPAGLLNPGKIVRPTKMDDATLFRFRPGYAPAAVVPALDWSAWDVQNDPMTEALSAPGTGGDPARGFAKAIEMCNNNGHCRRFDAGTMCPSFRVTRDEQHLTRGRANTLRLALSGQLGADALASAAVAAALDLCVSCKGCKRDCPTGVDMARMKIEFLHHYGRKHGTPLRDRVIAHLPRYAPWAARLPWLANLRDALPSAAALSERWFGLSAKRSLPKWRRDTFLSLPPPPAGGGGGVSQSEALRRRSDARLAARGYAGGGVQTVVLFADTFNNYFEPENAHAALKVLQAAGYQVEIARPATNDAEATRPLCCGRTYLAAGLVDEARYEARRVLAALGAFADKNIPIVGLEPSCLLGLRDEFLALGLGDAARKLGDNAVTLAEFLAREAAAGRLNLRLQPLSNTRALLHGHCHEKAFGALDPVKVVLGLIPQLEVQVIDSSCCGMAGSFGYDASHYAVSMQMGELSLLPAVRAAPADALVVANGTSCRHQIADGAARRAEHLARVLERALIR